VVNFCWSGAQILWKPMPNPGATPIAWEEKMGHYAVLAVMREHGG
jgi:hypothetical protein